MPDFELRDPRVKAVQWNGDNLDEMRAAFPQVPEWSVDKLGELYYRKRDGWGSVLLRWWLYGDPRYGLRTDSDAEFRQHFKPVLSADEQTTGASK